MITPELIGSSAAMRRVTAEIGQVAPTGATVLIEGETGTGKELIANAIHQLSLRSACPLVKLNCAAIPEPLLASELFGHERGAFTGAVERRRGRFEQAHGGTLFLDEIGELPRETQVLLLRVLQEGEFERLGGRQTVQVDVRVIAATNRRLEEDVRLGRFRSDLYYRLNVFPISVAPLRDRPEDIPGLVEHFVAKHAAILGKRVDGIDRRTLEFFMRCDWPGNVRELENAVERAVILHGDGMLRVDVDSECAVEPHERHDIEAALQESDGRIAGANGAARLLGMAPSTLEFRIRKLGINKYRYRRPERHAQLQIVGA